MKVSFTGVGLCLVGLALVTCAQGQNAPAAAVTKVELKRVHMCCDGCSDDVVEILKKVAGVTSVVVDQELKVARFLALDTKAAQKAIDALAAAGFHGDSGTDKYS